MEHHLPIAYMPLYAGPPPMQFQPRETSSDAQSVASGVTLSSSVTSKSDEHAKSLYHIYEHGKAWYACLRPSHRLCVFVVFFFAQGLSTFVKQPLQGSTSICGFGQTP